MNKFLVSLIAGLMVALMVSVKSCDRNAQEAERLGDNQRSLMTMVRKYMTKDSLSVASVERLTLTNKEFESYCGELKATVDALNLKVKRLQSVSSTGVKSVYSVSGVFTSPSSLLSKGEGESPSDLVSLSSSDSSAALSRCIDYENEWISFSGCEQEGVFSGRVETRDTLVTVVHRVPKKWWFIRWGTKAVRQEVMSKNPYSRIEYTEYIEF